MRLFRFSSSIDRLLFISTSLLFLLISPRIKAQEEPETEERKNRVSFVVGSSIVPGGEELEGENSRLAYMAFGIDYDRELNEKWGIGLHTDWVIENYKLENQFNGEEIIERKRPLALCLISSYSLNKLISLHAGIGPEITEEAVFFLTMVI